VDVLNLDDANCLITSSNFTQQFCTLTEVACDQPLDETFCYGENEDTTLEYVSEDGTPLNLTFTAGAVEVGFDDIIVFDTDGTILFDGDGELTGLTFQSTGDTISFQITSDGSVSCQSGARAEIEYTVNCATCINPVVDFELITDCLNAPQFFIDVNITDLGSATSLEISDSEGITTQTVTETGVVQVGPFPNGTDVTVDVLNLDDANCLTTSETFNQEFCTLTEVFCDTPLDDETYCYGDNEDVTIEYVSEDGTVLNMSFQAGTVQLNTDEFFVFDSDGSILYDMNAEETGFGAFDISGLSFQSTGDSISFQIISSGFTSCQSTASYDQFEYTVVCATCINPSADFELVSDCLNAPQFFVDVDITDLGSATSLEITDSEGISTVTVTEIGIVQVGPFPNGTDVTVDVLNLDDANCLITSSNFTQEFCTLTEVACDQPLDETFCYGENEDTTLEYVSEDGTPLNLTFTAGAVEVGFDDIIVFDTDGTILFDGDGELTGLTFQSTGDTISFQITSDGSVSCQSGARAEIEYTVNCATCINPVVDFELITDCLNAPQFFIDVNITDLGSATSLEITDSEGITTQTVTETGVVQVGPFPNGTDVTVDVLNVDDANCLITSEILNQEFCTLTEVFCDTPLDDETYCYGDNEDVTIEYVSEDGTILNMAFQAGTVQLNLDEFFVFDSDGSILYDMNAEETGFGAFDISGLSFQSTGDSISFQVISSGFTSCQSTAAYNQFEYSVVCATCINPSASYTILDNCTDDDNTDYFIQVNIDSLGDATSLLVTNDQGDTPQTATEITTLDFGPYPVGTLVEFTIANEDDANCTITSSPQGIESCDCFGADPFCAPTDNTPLVFDNVSDGSSAPPGIDYGCLGSQPDPVWFYLVVEETGDLNFEIVQSTQLDANGFPDQNNGLIDVDFIVWGPFTDPAEGCSNLLPSNQVDCSFSFVSIEDMTIPDAVAGEVYVVLITNFNGSAGFISLGQTNIGDPGSGTTNCDFIFTEYGCASEGVLLSSEVENGNAYQWFILDDPESDPEDTSNYIPVDDNGEGQDYLAIESGNYFVLSQAADNSFAEEFFTVQLSETPELSFELEQNLCIGDELTLDATPTNSDNYSDITYQWFDENGPIDVANNSEFTFTDTGLYTVEITTTELLGNTNFECVNVFEINIDGADFEIDLGGDQFYCDESESQSITAILSGAIEPDSIITYLWNTGNETETIQVSESGVYSVMVTVDGCEKEALVNYGFSTILQTDLVLEQNLCEGETLTLDATPVNSNDYNTISYQWFDANGPIDGEINNEFTFDSTGLYSVEITTEELVGDTSFECTTVFEIDIQGATFEIDLGEALTFCDEDEPQTITANLEGTIEPGAQISYLWSTGAVTETIQVSETGLYSVEVIVDGCPENAEITYTFNQSPQIELPTSVESCDLSTVIFDATPTNADPTATTFEWRLDGVLLQDEFMELLSANDYGFGTYQLTAYTNDEDCAFVQEIEVSPRFVSTTLTTDSFDNLFCVGEEVLIAADVTSAEGDDVTYTWFVNGVAQTDQNQAQFVHEIGSDTSNPNLDVIALSVNVGGDCVAETVEVELDRYPLDNCIIPEGMSPDGVNHTLDLRFLADRSGIRSLEIFNRFGRSVFSQSNYTDEFTGQNQNGTKLVTGTYFYVIKFNQEDPVYGREHKGWIYINREQQ